MYVRNTYRLFPMDNVDVLAREEPHTRVIGEARVVAHGSIARLEGHTKAGHYRNQYRLQQRRKSLFKSRIVTSSHL